MPQDSPAELKTSDALLTGWYGRILGLLALVIVAPIWLVEYPPLTDYPNHLARGYILYHIRDVPSFQEHFAIDTHPIPSLATDFFFVALQPLCDIRLTGKLFLTLTLWLYLAGWHLLGQAIHGQPTWLALAGALIAYHSMFLYGFTNFSFGLGTFLTAAAVWLPLRETWSWRRGVLSALLAVGCYFSHLSALIFLVGTALALTFWDFLQTRKLTRAMFASLAPLLAPLLFFFFRGESHPGMAWNTLAGKFIGALCLVRGYDERVDAVYIGVFLVGVILLLVWSTRIRIKGGVLFVGLGCVGMFLIGPYEIFGGAPADSRFLPAAFALSILSLDLTYPRRKALALLGLFLGLVIFRYGMIVHFWLAYDPALQDQVALLQSLPDHARVYPMVHAPEDRAERKLAVASFHVVNYAVIDRHIYSPHLFGFPGQQPLRYRAPRVAFHSSAEYFPPLAEVDWDTIFGNYDYLWCWHLPEDYEAFLRRRSTLVGEKGRASLWRVTKSR